MAETPDLRTRLAEAHGRQDRQRPAFEQPVIEARERVRGHVTKVVIYGYVAALAVILGWLLFVDNTQGAEKFTMVMDVIKIAALPVVTFVIGHYFGSQSN